MNTPMNKKPGGRGTHKAQAAPMVGVKPVGKAPKVASQIKVSKTYKKNRGGEGTRETKADQMARVTMAQSDPKVSKHTSIKSGANKKSGAQQGNFGSSDFKSKMVPGKMGKSLSQAFAKVKNVKF